MKDKVLTIDDAIEILQKAKEEYGNLPIIADIDTTVEEIDTDVWNIKDIRYDNESVILYNY